MKTKTREKLADFFQYKVFEDGRERILIDGRGGNQQALLIAILHNQFLMWRKLNRLALRDSSLSDAAQKVRGK